MVRRVVVFTGRVQGVGFRATAASCAGRHPVTGWVRNEADGTVRMEVQGEASDVQAALDDLRHAMRGNIRSEHAHDAPADPDEHGFSIAR